MALWFNNAQSASYDIPLLFLSENLRMLNMALRLKPDFSTELDDFDCAFCDLLPSQMMEKVLWILFDQCDLTSDAYENFYIESELFIIISSGNYLNSKYCTQLEDILHELEYSISDDIELNVDLDEIDSEDEMVNDNFIVDLFKEDRLELTLYSTEEIAYICECFIELKEILELMKEESYGDQKKHAA